MECCRNGFRVVLGRAGPPDPPGAMARMAAAYGWGLYRTQGIAYAALQIETSPVNHDNDTQRIRSRHCSSPQGNLPESR